MAFMAAMLKSTLNNTSSISTTTTTLGLRRCFHAIAIPSPINNVIDHGRSSISSPPLVLPEVDRSFDKSDSGFRFPSFSFGGSMELMAVPKRKTTPHKKKIRNIPKALKPAPVIVRCRACGKVKLPHFYCCSGKRDNEGDQHQHHSTG